MNYEDAYYSNTHGLIDLYQDYVKTAQNDNPDTVLVLEILYTMRYKLNQTIKLWESKCIK
jgi:hypothetical protein